MGKSFGVLVEVGGKGRYPMKKNVYFRALAESGGEEAPARIFGPHLTKY